MWLDKGRASGWSTTHKGDVLGKYSSHAKHGIHKRNQCGVVHNNRDLASAGRLATIKNNKKQDLFMVFATVKEREERCLCWENSK